MKFPEPIHQEKTGRRGRPRKHVDENLLREAMDPRRNINISNLARRLKVGRDTLRRELKRFGISRDFTQISNTELDAIVKSFRHNNPESGIGYLVGHIRSHRIRVQRDRVRRSVARVDQIGRTLRRKAKVHRRKYQVSRPNALWHIDGHHKLIAWGIVIHGCVDGYSRAVKSRKIQLSLSTF